MAKKKSKKSKVTMYNARGIVFKDILWYYDTNAGFLEALPGFKLWAEVEANNK